MQPVLYCSQQITAIRGPKLAMSATVSHKSNGSHIFLGNKTRPAPH